MSHDGTGTGWDETLPANVEDAGYGAQEIRDLRIALGNRTAMEHVDFGAAKAGGEHLAGSAKAFYDDNAAVTDRPDGVNDPWGDGATALGSPGDDGRLLVDDGSGAATAGTLLYYDGGWNAIVIEAANMAADSVATASILDNNVTLAKLVDFGGQGYILRGGAAGAPEEHDASTDKQILVGDGTDIKSVAMTGDVTISNAGVTAIGATKILASMLNASAQLAYGTGVGSDVADRTATLAFNPVYIIAWNESDAYAPVLWSASDPTNWKIFSGSHGATGITVAGNVITFIKNKNPVNVSPQTFYYFALGGTNVDAV